MWWYKKKTDDSTAEVETAPRPTTTPTERAIHAWAEALRGAEVEPDGLLAMALVVAGKLVFEDGTRIEDVSIYDAEKIIERALGAREPLRLYNRFAKNFDEAYALRDDTPEEHRKRLQQLAKRVGSAPGVRSFTVG